MNHRKNQYQRKFKEPLWNFNKNITKNGWKYVLCKVAKRQGLQRPTEVSFYGQEVPETKIKKARSQFPLFELSRIEKVSPTPPTPEGISVYTPLFIRMHERERSVASATAPSSSRSGLGYHSTDSDDSIISFLMSIDLYRGRQSKGRIFGTTFPRKSVTLIDIQGHHT